MDYQCIKGNTLKNGKHFGVHEIITQEQYDKLPEKNKMFFMEIEIPKYEEDDDLDTEDQIQNQIDLTPDWQPDEPTPDFIKDDTPDFPGYGGGESGGAGASETY